MKSEAGFTLDLYGVEMRWADVTRDDLNAALASLKTGHDPEAARNLIEYFHERMSNGFQYDESILRDLVAHAFAGIIAGKTADQAFGLKLERGKYERVDKSDREAWAAAYVVLLRRKGSILANAISDASTLLFTEGGDKIVERAYEEYRSELEEYSDTCLFDMVTDAGIDPVTLERYIKQAPQDRKRKPKRK